MKLTVKNFGPLKDVSLDLKDIMVFIGPQAAGKSTLAKLIYILKGRPNLTQDEFKGYCVDYHIDYFTDDTEIEFEEENTRFIYQPNQVGQQIQTQSAAERTLPDLTQRLLRTVQNSLEEEKRKKDALSSGTNIQPVETDNSSEVVSELFSAFLQVITPTARVYVPAERTFYSHLALAIMSIFLQKISLPKLLVELGAELELARQKTKTLSIPFLGAEYRYEKEKSQITFNNQTVDLDKASSGMQAIVPILLVLENIKRAGCYVVEEPELNLFPDAQKSLVEHIVSKCTFAPTDKNTLVITTHSPYVLTALNNLIQAGNVVSVKPHLRQQVLSIINQAKPIDFEQIGVYYVNNGSTHLIMDSENRLIDATAIDDVSEKLGDEFERLMELELNV